MRRTATFTAGVVLAATAGTGIAAWGVPALAQDKVLERAESGELRGPGRRGGHGGPGGRNGWAEDSTTSL